MIILNERKIMKKSRRLLEIVEWLGNGRRVRSGLRAGCERVGSGLRAAFAPRLNPQPTRNQPATNFSFENGRVFLLLLLPSLFSSLLFLYLFLYIYIFFFFIVTVSFHFFKLVEVTMAENLEALKNPRESFIGNSFQFPSYLFESQNETVRKLYKSLIHLFTVK